MTAAADVLLLFLRLSLLAIGGGDSIVPEMQRLAVEVHRWMTDREFLDLFALSRVAPGPGSLVVVLIGQKAAGPWGAVAAAAGLYLPASMLMYATTRLWQNGGAAAWKRLAERSLLPIGVGLIFAGGIVLLSSSRDPGVALVLAAAAAAVAVFRSINPLWLVALGGVVGGAVGL